MYSVVGCSECQHLWIVEGRPETTQCPRCRSRHRFESLKAFAETDSSDAAARVRGSMLADRADDGEFLDPAEVDTESVGVDDEAYLSASMPTDSVSTSAGSRNSPSSARSASIELRTRAAASEVSVSANAFSDSKRWRVRQRGHRLVSGRPSTTHRCRHSEQPTTEYIRSLRRPPD